MTLGSLRDQILYPDTYEDMIRKGITDEDLLKYLEVVKLTYVQEREGRWDAVADWMDVLSGGEKQRIAVSPTASGSHFPNNNPLLFENRWLVCSTTSRSSPFWTSARQPSAWTSKVACTSTVARWALLSSPCPTAGRSGNITK